MPNEEHLPTRQPADLSDDRQRAVDELGRRAGEALRSPAPESGAAAIMRRARNQRVARAGGAAIGLLAMIAITVIVVGIVKNHDREPADNDTTNDTVAAQSALVEPADLGAGWTISHEYDGLTSRGVAAVAARVPECAPYLDYAFDSPSRQSVTTGRIFNGPPNFTLTQWVYIFPTTAAASTAMDKIGEESFQPCFDTFMDALLSELAPDFPLYITSIDPPQVADHGDRQVVVAQSMQVPGARFTVINGFIQVGRGIVYIDPTIDAPDGDPAPVDEAYSAATEALKDALDQT